MNQQNMLACVYDTRCGSQFFHGLLLCVDLARHFWQTPR